MKAVVQRVSGASVTVDGEIKGKIGKGFLVFLGVGKKDSELNAERLANKIIKMRIFSRNWTKTGERKSASMQSWYRCSKQTVSYTTAES